MNGLKDYFDFREAYAEICRLQDCRAPGPYWVYSYPTEAGHRKWRFFPIPWGTGVLSQYLVSGIYIDEKGNPKK